MEKFSVRTTDGVLLHGVLYFPQSSEKGVVQINAATATSRSYYEPFARFLSAQGWIVALWDYRGSGESKAIALKDSRYRMLDYGDKDMPAVLDYLAQRFSNLPIVMLGHSVGGHLVGFMPNANRLAGHIAVASSTGYLGYMPWGFRLKSLYFFYLLTPVSDRIAGYSATTKFGWMEDLPSTVVHQWRDWCTRPDYFFDPKFYGKSVPLGIFQKLDFSVRVYYAEDDPISNERSVPRFWSHVRSSRGLEIIKLRPQEFGAKEIGHFGYFSKKFQRNIWSMFLADIEGFAQDYRSRQNFPSST
jgi:predicted alpha/beta hydrolase